MTAHPVAHHREPSPVRRMSKLVQLNWADFWLLLGILGGMLGLFALVYLAYLFR